MNQFSSHAKLIAISFLFIFSLTRLNATPINSDPGGGGAGGNAASAPGPSSSYPWVGTVDGTNTGTGNKTTAIPTVSWTSRGGMTVDLTLYHNSQTNFASPFGYKWLLIYESQVKADASGNVTVGWGDGRRYTFGNNSGSYSAPPGIHERLVANGSPVSSYDIIEKNQTRYRFSNYSGVFVLNTITDENGNQITVNNGTNGGLISITDSSNRTVTFGYNGPTAGYYNTITDPKGRVIGLAYDSSYNLSQVTCPTLNGSSYSITLGYDSQHDVTSIKDLRGNTSTFFYNSADKSLAWEKDAVGNQTTFTYGSPYSYDTTITDANGNKTIHAYTSGRLAQVSDALGYTEYYSYDTGNNVTQREDRRGYYWNSTYDGMGNVLTAKDPYGNTTTYTYNAHNRMLTAQTPLSRSIAVTYDAYDNPTQVQQKDAAGNVKATTNLTIGAYGLVSDKYDANHHHTAYTYDANGYLASTTTPLGHKTQWTYDALGFQAQRVDAMGRTTYYAPDAWERLTTITYPDSTNHTFSYDANGNLTNWGDPTTGPWSRTYDSDNRVSAEYRQSTLIVSHTYDAAGQKGLLSTTTDFFGRVITYAYSARNELASVGEATGTETYAYDADGNQTHRYLPNGLRTDQYYNNDGTLQRYYNWNGSNTIVSSYGYFYNADHQMNQCNEAQNYPVGGTPAVTTTTYAYDPLGHLSNETRNGSSPINQNYTVDGVGNRTLYMNGGMSPSTLDADDELTGSTGTNTFVFGYNGNGDRTTETFNGQGTTFGYDYDDQLVSLVKPGMSVSYQYDALGRQVGKTVNGAATGIYYDGGSVLFENGATPTVQYTWGNGLIRAGSEYPLSDGRGNTRQTTNGSQAVTAANAPDAFGVSSYTGASSSPYWYGASSGYRGEGFSPAGLPSVYGFEKVGARYYDPTFGCFLTRDTELSQSPYAYCDGDPVNCTDPTGHLSAVNIAAGAMPISGVSGGAADAPVDTSGDNKPSKTSSGNGTYKVDVTVKQQDPITTVGLGITLTLGRTTLTNTTTATITPITTSFGSVTGVIYNFGRGLSIGLTYATPNGGKGPVTGIEIIKTGTL